tara:strand:+ start:514 stop:699 length:186 start_codon:yes stop_codon:yes gene_type:complete
MAKDRYRVWVGDVEVAYDVTLKEARITASEFACQHYTGIDIEKLEDEDCDLTSDCEEMGFE